MLHSSPQEAVVQVTSAGGRQGRDLLVATALQIRLDLEQQVAIALNEAVGLQRLDESPGESLGCKRNLNRATVLFDGHGCTHLMATCLTAGVP